MLFNSIEFLIFLPIVFIIYWMLSENRLMQNIFVVCASYIFYGWWDWRFLILIIFISTVSFSSGILIERYRSNRKICRSIVAISVILCLAVLGTFKYFDFFSRNLSRFLSMFGIYLNPFTLEVVVPVGMSFYTLQALSYTIDVYRKDVAATYNVPAFFAFIGFFPQLVAGPIERASNLLPQFLSLRKFSYPQAVEGMQQILWGLFKKMVIADGCAIAVNSIYSSYNTLDGGTLIWGAFFFSFQIYGDFSGYSDIAIGTARLFGITLSRNFHYPYLSRNVAEFWRRWHSSLNRWFVHYVYIPLGGSRGSVRLTVFNTLLIFLLSAFWHGSSWSFIAWGLFNAIIFIPLIFLRQNKKYCNDVVASRTFWPTLVEVLQMALTFILITFSRIFFRSDSFMDSLKYIKRIFTHFSFTFPTSYISVMIFILLLIVIEYLQRHRDFGLQLSNNGIFKWRAARWLIYYIVAVIIIVWAESPKTFIYFQF